MTRHDVDVKFQASSKKLFNLQKFWLLLENGRLSDPAVPHNSSTSYSVVYSVDSNMQAQFSTNFTYSLSELGISVLSKLRILADCEVTWVQLNRRTGPKGELQVSQRNA